MMAADAGFDQPGFRALLELGATRRAFVKLSGFVKFSREPSHANPYPRLGHWWEPRHKQWEWAVPTVSAVPDVSLALDLSDVPEDLLS